MIKTGTLVEIISLTIYGEVIQINQTTQMAFIDYYTAKDGYIPQWFPLDDLRIIGKYK